MSSIDNIATNKNIKLYKGDYKLKPYNSNDSIQELLFKYRINNNLTFKDLSCILPYSESYLCNVENMTIHPNDNLINLIYELTTE